MQVFRRSAQVFDCLSCPYLFMVLRRARFRRGSSSARAGRALADMCGGGSRRHAGGRKMRRAHVSGGQKNVPSRHECAEPWRAMRIHALVRNRAASAPSRQRAQGRMRRTVRGSRRAHCARHNAHGARIMRGIMRTAHALCARIMRGAHSSRATRGPAPGAPARRRLRGPPPGAAEGAADAPAACFFVLNRVERL